MPEFTMPQLGESVSEGTITRWLKKEGESVRADEAVVEVSTDKVDSEIPSPFGGTLARILAKEGDTVPVGAPIAEISPAEGSGSAGSPAGEKSALSPQTEAAREGQLSDSEASPVRAGSGSAGRVLSPLVRKLAAEKGVDLAQVQGTGTAGRITRDDVLRHAGPGNGDSTTSPVRQDIPVPAETGDGDATTGQRVPGEEPGDEVMPLTNMRKVIADQMVRSLRETARAWNTIEVDMTSIGKLRKAAGGSFKRTMGYSLTWTPFVARALTQALLEYPQVNSSWNGDGTVTRKGNVNLGIAVALEKGLIVPVIKRADQMNVLGLAAAIRDVAMRAREKKLKVDEVRNGTFTLTNPGPFGSVMSVPIINPGEAAILGFDAIVKRPVVITAPDGTDSIGIREMVFLSLSWDHRLIDGAEAAQFLARLKSILEKAEYSDDLAHFLR